MVKPREYILHFYRKRKTLENNPQQINLESPLWYFNSETDKMKAVNWTELNWNKYKGKSEEAKGNIMFHICKKWKIGVPPTEMKIQVRKKFLERISLCLGIDAIHADKCLLHTPMTLGARPHIREKQALQSTWSFKYPKNETNKHNFMTSTIKMSKNGWKLSSQPEREIKSNSSW